MLPFDRKEIKQEAKQYLHNDYVPMVGVGLMLSVATGALGANTGARVTVNQPIDVPSSNSYPLFTRQEIILFLTIFFAVLAIGILITVFLLHPLEYGCRSWFLRKLENDEQGAFGSGFDKGNYRRVIKALFLKNLYIIIGLLLFVVPGVILAYRYYFVTYLLDDYPELSTKEIFQMSKEMTDGHKMDLLTFDLSFIGWAMLASLTAGITGIFYSFPYQFMSQTILYDNMINLKEKGTDEGT